MEAILVDCLQTVGQLARRCINLYGGQKGGLSEPLRTPPGYGPDPAYSCLQEHSLDMTDVNCMVCSVSFHMQPNLAAAMCISTFGQLHLPSLVCSCTTMQHTSGHSLSLLQCDVTISAVLA